MSAIAAALLFASASLNAADLTALDAATREVFAPYNSDDDSPASWERDIWSREVRQLVVHWQSVVPEGEPDALNDGDWLCQCQDWDQQRFRASVLSRKALTPDKVRVAVRIDLGHGAKRKARLTFVREQGRWLIDDLHDRYLDQGLKVAIRQTIAEDEALLKAARP